MLRVIIALCWGGLESGRRVIATADIGRIRDRAFADIECVPRNRCNDVGDEVVVAD